MGIDVSTTSIFGISGCVPVGIWLLSSRLNIVSSISSAAGNSIFAIAVFGTSIRCAGDNIVVADDTGGGGGSIVAIGAGV